MTNCLFQFFQHFVIGFSLKRTTRTELDPIILIENFSKIQIRYKLKMQSINEVGKPM